MRELKITSRFTNRVSKGLGVYLNEISRERMISPEEEAELGRKLHGKGAEAERAKERLVRANLRFVVSVAKQYQGRSLSLEDLINEGNIGLVKAVNHFDETRGFKFISYAVWWIRQSIIEAIGVKSRAVRVPLSAAGTARAQFVRWSTLWRNCFRPMPRPTRSCAYWPPRSAATCR